MIASRDDLIRMITGQQEPKVPTVEVTFDPDEIRDLSRFVEAARRRILLRLAVFGLPIMLLLGLIGNYTSWTFLSTITATAVVAMALFELLGVLVSIGWVTLNEQRGDFDRMAGHIFLAHTPYWLLRDFEDNLNSSVFAAVGVIALLSSLFLLQWYGVLALVVATLAVDGWACKFYNVKGKSLIIYKQEWDEHQAKIDAEARERQRQQDDLLREVGMDGTEEPNALDEDGPYFDPDPVTDVKYVDDEDGDPHLRGG